MKNYRYRPIDNDIKIRYISTEFNDSDLGPVLRGHNKKVIITIDNQAYYFKYDTEKEKLGNIQKPIASSFCSWLTRRYGGNFVVDIPGEAVVHTGGKENYDTHLKGVFSKSYRDDPNVIATFTLDQVLRPGENENFKYTNEERVFSSVQSSIIRLISFIGDKNNQQHPLTSKLKYLQEDMKQIEEDLVSIVTLDYLFLNNDRHTENIEFAIVVDPDGEYHLVVSPVFDNDRTLGLDKTESQILDSCSSQAKREIYVNYPSDLKYVILDDDINRETAMKRNFANNFNSDRIAEYVAKRSFDENGRIDREKLSQNPIYNLFENYKNLNIRQEFFQYLGELIGIDYPLELTPEQEPEFLEQFNKITNSTLSMLHVQELSENFEIRQKCLTKSMAKYVSTSCSTM